MRLIRQKKEKDCGVACVAMIADVSYKEALNAFYETERLDKYKDHGTTTSDLWAALWYLGIENFDKRLHYAKNNLFVPYDTIYKLEIPDLVNWHWIVISKNKVVYDPNKDYPLHLEKVKERDSSYISRIKSRMIKL